MTISLRASVTIRPLRMCRAVRRDLPKPVRFASNQGILNHARNVAISETHVFSPNSVNEFTAGYNRIFDYISSQGTGSCESQAIGIPGANLGGVSCGLTSAQLDGGYWSLGDRGYSPFQGGTNVFSVVGFVRHDSRQSRHQSRRFHSRHADERAGGRFPGWLLDLHRPVAGEPEADLLTRFAEPGDS